jgi:hypothetical protein
MRAMRQTVWAWAGCLLPLVCPAVVSAAASPATPPRAQDIHPSVVSWLHAQCPDVPPARWVQTNGAVACTPDLSPAVRFIAEGQFTRRDAVEAVVDVDDYTVPMWQNHGYVLLLERRGAQWLPTRRVMRRLVDVPTAQVLRGRDGHDRLFACESYMGQGAVSGECRLIDLRQPLRRLGASVAIADDRQSALVPHWQFHTVAAIELHDIDGDGLVDVRLRTREAHGAVADKDAMKAESGRRLGRNHRLSLRFDGQVLRRLGPWPQAAIYKPSPRQDF